MKKITLLSLCFAVGFANAQSIKLENNKLIKITTATKTNSETPGGGESKTDVSTTTTLKITAVEDKMYKATSTVIKMVMDGEMMGQSMKFDSDKKEDMDSQIGQMLGGSVNKASEITIGKTDGKVTEIVGGEEKQESGMGGMMGGESNAAKSVFFVIPDGKKAGDKWTVSTNEDGMKTITNYELQALKNDVATVLVSSTTIGTATKEANGMSMEMTVDTKSKGTMMLDTKNGLIKKLTTDVETTGSMDVMGQSIPLNNKSNTVMTVE